MEKMLKSLYEGAEKLDISISDDMADKFCKYTGLLLEWNEKMNLTAITAPEEIAVKHYLDSLTFLKFIDVPRNSRIIDVGCGAGFPSIPLMIARSDIHITMLDGTKKRLNFIDEVVNALRLNGETLHARAEEAGKSAKYREKFDFATARAVARLNVLSEYCLPFVRVGGSFVAMKASITNEADEAQGAIRLLGGKLGDIKEFSLPDGSERRLVVTKKISQTPPKYPRASAQIAKKALK